jgi:hypothetical protein
MPLVLSMYAPSSIHPFIPNSITEVKNPNPNLNPELSSPAVGAATTSSPHPTATLTTCGLPSSAQHRRPTPAQPQQPVGRPAAACCCFTNGGHTELEVGFEVAPSVAGLLLLPDELAAGVPGSPSRCLLNMLISWSCCS